MGATGSPWTAPQPEDSAAAAHVLVTHDHGLTERSPLEGLGRVCAGGAYAQGQGCAVRITLTPGAPLPPSSLPFVPFYPRTLFKFYLLSLHFIHLGKPLYIHSGIRWV